MIHEMFLIDTETTGLRGYPIDHVVDVGICKIDLRDGSVEPVYESVVGHNVALWDEEHQNAWIFEHSDLTLKDVASAKSADDVAVDMYEILRSEYLTSYNVGFDIQKFLRYAPFRVGEYVSRILPDPMLIATDICCIPGACSSYKWPKLEEAYSILCPDDPANIKGCQDHRALSDARVASYVLIELHKRGLYEV